MCCQKIKWLLCRGHISVCEPLVQHHTATCLLALCEPFYRGGENTHSLCRVYQPVSHHCARSPVLRDSAESVRACVCVCVCVCGCVCVCVWVCFTAVPGLRNLGNGVEQSIGAVTIRQPVEHGKLVVQSDCFEFTRTLKHKHAHIYTPAISNDDLCPAWGQACITVEVANTQIHLHTLSQLNTQEYCIFLSLQFTLSPSHL